MISSRTVLQQVYFDIAGTGSIHAGISGEDRQHAVLLHRALHTGAVGFGRRSRLEEQRQISKSGTRFVHKTPSAPWYA